jgi:hypothetical protein
MSIVGKRLHMKNILAVIGIFIIFFILSMLDIGMPEGRFYDCGMAEWHPDIPHQVKEECRRRHYEEWKKKQQDDTYQKSLLST